jgi:hypothetical protein
LRTDKRDIVVDYIIKKEPELKITREDATEYLKTCGKVSKTMFGRLLTQFLTAETEAKNELIEICGKILETKKSRNMEEEKVIDHMKKRLFPKPEKG